jgi:hypothetical protein
MMMMGLSIYYWFFFIRPASLFYMLRQVEFVCRWTILLGLLLLLPRTPVVAIAQN